MDEIGWVVIVICIVFIGAVFACGLGNYYENCVYENYTAIITQHYDEEYTTFLYVSNGKTVSMMPMCNHDFYIVADNQSFSVNESFWRSCDVNDSVMLTKNLNNSEVKVNRLV